METKHSKYILAGLTVLCVLLICITSLKDGIMEPLRTGVGYFSDSHTDRSQRSGNRHL